MGAYLFFKLARKNQADEYNKFIAETEEGKRLIKADALLTVVSKSDIEWAKKDSPNWVRYFKEQLGKGEFKASGVQSSEIYNSGCETLEEYYELLTNLLVKAQNRFKMWFAARSCAFNLDGTYFSIEQNEKNYSKWQKVKTFYK